MENGFSSLGRVGGGKSGDRLPIGTLNNNKIPGPNRVTSELIKLLDEEAREKLLELLSRCWEEEELLEEMNQADLAVIYKKGPTDKPENYRPIALLSISYKLMASMMQNRNQKL